MRKSLLLTTVCVIAASIPLAGVAKSYHSNLLERMASTMQIAAQLDSLDNGFHYRTFVWGGNPISVRIDSDEVAHIGYSLFPVPVRSGLPTTICDFIERYLLELSLPLPREKTIHKQLLEDGFICLEGAPETMVAAMCSDTALTINLTNVLEKRYCLEWKNSIDSGSVVFPADWQLLSGRDMVENENRLPVEIAKYDNLWKEHLPDTASLTPSEQGLLVHDGGYYYVKSLACTQFYRHEKDTVRLVDDPSIISAYTANLFTSTGLHNDFILNIKMRVFGLTSTYFKVPLNQWISFCLANGCKPYWGIISVSEDILEGELIMRNADLGYNHVMRIWLPTELLHKGSGEIQTRLVPYVPTHNLSYLFDEIKL